MNKELIKKANEELKRLMKWFEDNKDAFNYMDLKLHDVQSYNWREGPEEYPLPYEENEDYDLFYRFADISYDQFIEDLREDGIKFEPKHIGTTSKFYLHDNDIIEFTGRYRDEFNWEYMLYNLVNRYGYNDVVPDITANGSIDENDKYLEDCEANLKYIAEEMYKEITEYYFGDVIKIYDYIKDFKENQVQYYKEWLEELTDEIEYEREKEAERQFNSWLDLVSIVLA